MDKEKIVDEVDEAIEEVKEEQEANTAEISNQEISQTPSLTYKEMKALKRSRYHEIFEKFDTSYVLENKKTGQIVEIRAASSLHACNIIGWKKNKVRILKENLIVETNESNVSSSDSPVVSEA